jgi:hypothetical protein
LTIEASQGFRSTSDLLKKPFAQIPFAQIAAETNSRSASTLVSISSRVLNNPTLIRIVPP